MKKQNNWRKNNEEYQEVIRCIGYCVVCISWVWECFKTIEIEENIDRYESIVPDEGVEHVSDDDLGFLVEEHNKAAQAMEEMILDILEVAPGDYNGGMIRAYKDASEIASKKEYRILSKLSVYKLSLSETISYIMGK